MPFRLSDYGADLPPESEMASLGQTDWDRIVQIVVLSVTEYVYILSLDNNSAMLYHLGALR
jgi:hypothetical protein